MRKLVGFHESTMVNRLTVNPINNTYLMGCPWMSHSNPWAFGQVTGFRRFSETFLLHMTCLTTAAATQFVTCTQETCVILQRVCFCYRHF